MTTESEGTESDGTPSEEELLARYEDLHRRATELKDRLDSQTRVSPLQVAVRVFAMFGLPVIAAIAVFVMTESVLYAMGALVAVVIAVVSILSRLTPAAPGPGTRAWEAEHTARLLDGVIADRMKAKSLATGDDERAKLGREIAFLEQQRAEQIAIASSGDRSPGTGSIGFTAYSGD